MTQLQIFAFFGVPVLVVAFALLVYFFEGRRRRGHVGPDIFDKKPRTPGE